MKYFEDITVGDRFSFGQYRVDEAEMLAFAGKYDPQRFHIDAEAAAETIYGGLIASGILTMAIMLRLLIEEFRESDMHGSPGWDEVRWTRPVRAGDVLSAECEITATRASKSRPELGIVHARCRLRNQEGETVFTARPIWFMGRRGVDTNRS